MLPLKNRLKKKKDFEKVLKEGKGFLEKFIYFKFVKNGLDFSRFGFVVSKKISKKSTARNKLKRQFREILRKNLNNIKNGFDSVFIATNKIKNESFPEIAEIIRRILNKAKILNEKSQS